MAYRIEVNKRVSKNLANLPRDVQKRILDQLEELQENPFAPGVIKLKGEESYRVRVGDYRIVFDVDTKAQKITVLAADHRKDVYRS
jgi:mRNA interferase RelE/StbE